MNNDMRKAFEQHMQEKWAADFDLSRNDDGDYCNHTAEVAWHSFGAGLRNAISGWSVVPNEPTESQKECSAFNLCNDYGPDYVMEHKDFALDVYLHMIAVAPKPDAGAPPERDDDRVNLERQVYRLKEALFHAIQCWHHDGVSPEHGSVFSECNSRIDETEKL